MKAQIKLDDIGYAVLISVDYAHNSEEDAKHFFTDLYTIMISNGYSFDNRIFYKIGSQNQIETELKATISFINRNRRLDPQKFLRSVHLIPLSNFQDITAQVAAGI